MNKLVLTALSSIDVPVSFQSYTGTEDTYVTFFFYAENSAQSADDVETASSHYVQVDVWSKSDYTNLVNEVKSAMKTAGFGRLMAMDLYEKDTKIYHKPMRFKYNFQEA